MYDGELVNPELVEASMWTLWVGEWSVRGGSVESGDRSLETIGLTSYPMDPTCPVRLMVRLSRWKFRLPDLKSSGWCACGCPSAECRPEGGIKPMWDGLRHAAPVLGAGVGISSSGGPRHWGVEPTRERLRKC